MSKAQTHSRPLIGPDEFSVGPLANVKEVCSVTVVWISARQILKNFTSVHLSHVELKNMGQQSETGRYPLHFHMCGDVDRRGGYGEPTYVDGLSIHHSFSRCLTIHATNGLLVSHVCLRLRTVCMCEAALQAAVDMLCVFGGSKLLLTTSI